MPDSTPLAPSEHGASDTVRVQILTNEHLNLLYTRGMTWNEMFARAGMYLTVLSAATVALALVAQASGFGDRFHLFALLVLPVVLLLGLGTQIRLGDARGEDVWLVVGMNRLRHAYLEMAPELEPYFVTAHHDDLAGVGLTYGPCSRMTPARVLASSPTLVGLINAAVAGLLVAFIVEALGGSPPAYVSAGVLTGLTYVGACAVLLARHNHRNEREWRPRFPGPASAR